MASNDDFNIYSLPAELWAKVTHYVASDPRSLASLAQTCRTFKVHADIERRKAQKVARVIAEAIRTFGDLHQTPFPERYLATLEHLEHREEEPYHHQSAVLPFIDQFKKASEGLPHFVRLLEQIGAGAPPTLASCVLVFKSIVASCSWRVSDHVLKQILTSVGTSGALSLLDSIASLGHRHICSNFGALCAKRIREMGWPEEERKKFAVGALRIGVDHWGEDADKVISERGLRQFLFEEAEESVE